MATTQIADVIVPEVFVPYMEQASNKASRLISSTAVFRSALMDEKLAGGGSTFNAPSFNPIVNADDDYDVSSDDPTSSATPSKISAVGEVVARLDRNKSWASADLAAQLAGADPMQEIAMRLGEYQASRRQRILVKQLNGIFGAASMAGGVNDISIATGTIGDANLVSAGAVIDTTSAWGDYAANNVGKILFVHSVVYRNLQKQNLIDFVPTSAQNIGFGTYLGMTLVVDDGMPVDTSTPGYPVYTSMIVGQGAIAFGYARPRVPVAFDRDELAGDGGGVETLVVRDAFAFHVAGTKWVGTAAGASPSDTELATGTNWLRVLDQKLVPIAALKTNG